MYLCRQSQLRLHSLQQIKDVACSTRIGSQKCQSQNFRRLFISQAKPLHSSSFPTLPQASPFPSPTFPQVPHCDNASRFINPSRFTPCPSPLQVPTHPKGPSVGKVDLEWQEGRCDISKVRLSRIARKYPTMGDHPSVPSRYSLELLRTTLAKKIHAWRVNSKLKPPR